MKELQRKSNCDFPGYILTPTYIKANMATYFLGLPRLQIPLFINTNWKIQDNSSILFFF